MTTRRALAWGAAAAALYVAAIGVTAATRLVPVRPLYDGTGPPPRYNWVKPPPDMQEGNTPAAGTTDEIAFKPEGSEPKSVNTPDGQAIVITQLGAFAPREGQSAVQIEIEPLDPEPLPEPDDLVVDGNAYRVTAVYKESQEPAELVQRDPPPVTMVLRYASHATTVLRLDGRKWTDIEAEPARAQLQLYTDTNRFGTFAAAGAPVDTGPPWWAFALGGAAVAASGVELYRIQRKRKKAAVVTRQARRHQQRKKK